MGQFTESWAAEQGTDPVVGISDPAAHGDGRVNPLGSDEAPVVDRWKKLVWHGGSVYDAWLNTASAQVGKGGWGIVHL